MIHCSNPLSEYLELKSEIDKKINSVLESGYYILGPEVELFEKSFAEFNKAKYAIGVASGTDALILSLKALGIKKEDEVITVSHTALATVASIIETGATPVLIDITQDDFTINHQNIEDNITDKTKAIIAVHLYGQPANMTEIMKIAKKNNLYVIEDCAQAHGAMHNKKQVGTFGDIACFSFYPTKNLGAIGDGGCITTSNEELYQKVLQLRQYGWNDSRISFFTSKVSRLDEIQASILNVKLKYLTQNNQKRNKIAENYNDNLKEIVSIPKIHENNNSVYHLYVIKTNKRDKLKEHLLKNNIGTAIHYNPAIHEQPGYKNLIKIDKHTLNNTMAVCQDILSLPIFPGLKKEEQDLVIKNIKTFFINNN